MLDRQGIIKIAEHIPSDIDAITQTIYDASTFTARAAEYVRSTARDAPEGSQQRYREAMLSALRSNLKSALILAAKLGELEEIENKINTRIAKNCQKFDAGEKE